MWCRRILIPILCFQSIAYTGKLDDIINHISTLYVEATTISDLQENAITHIFSELDQHSQYIPSIAAKSLQEALSGKFYGIGALLKLKDNQLMVDHVLPKSPAEKSGLLVNDVITQINEQSIDPNNMDINLSRIRGKKKSYITITLKSEKTLKIQREKIDREYIHYTNKGDLGYIEINLFNQKTTSKLKSMISETHHKAYLIDLRFNPGGLLYASLQSAGLFISNESEITLTHIQNKDGIHEIIAKQNKEDIAGNAPIYILLSPYSASGAELFASILQYYNRATIMGETSYGKGSIQTLVPLEDNTMAKITSAYFTTPDGSAIDQVGISPNIHLNTKDSKGAISYILNAIKNENFQ